MTTAAIGEEGFRWFIGVIEDREDPKKLGRVRVRIYNVHPFTAGGAPDKINVPTEHLPWASPINSIISAGIYSGSIKDGVGISPTGLMVNSTVFGFFLDGNECQMPVIFGSIAGLAGTTEQNELPKPSINENSAGGLKSQKNVGASGPFPGEPGSPYAAKYPYNKVFRTENGHLIEIDDTPSNERIHIMHKTGAYVEINRDGEIVIKAVDDRFDVTQGNNNQYVGGNFNVKIKGNVNVNVDGTYNVTSSGNMKFTAPRIDLN